MTQRQWYGKLYTFAFRHFRTRRMRRFAKTFVLQPSDTVLDVGGTADNWKLIPEQPSLVLLNLYVPRASARGRAMWVRADGTYLPFKDGVFDIVYSNSVIEHLQTFENQRRFATECQRVGQSYYVQTPNYWFFIEPHYLTPFIHWLPAAIQGRLLRYGTLWGLMTCPTQAQCASILHELRLLKEQEVRELFPQAELWYERFIGLTKSFMAVSKRSEG